MMMNEFKQSFGVYDFGLAKDQEIRAQRLHTESLIIDLMYWGPVSYRSFDDKLEARLVAMYEMHRDPMKAVFEAFEIGGRLAVEGKYPEFHDAWLASGLTAGQYPLMIGSQEALLASASHLNMMVDRLPWVRKALRADDIVEAKKLGQLAYFGLCQPIEPVSRDLRLLEWAYDFGLRILQLTYNDQDFVGAGCTDRTNAGVSNFGRSVIARCNELGIIVDTGHCGRQTTLDACAMSNKPVIASHTTCAAVYRHDRGKTDAELEAIAATGGVIGLVTAPILLESVKKATINTWLDHVEHVARVVGHEYVAVGTDFPPAGPKWTAQRLSEFAHTHGFRAADHGTNDTTFNLPGFDDYRDLPNLTRGLVSRGWSDDQIRGALGLNALRVFRAVCG
jgi:membrane dipeptidase